MCNTITFALFFESLSFRIKKERKMKQNLLWKWWSLEFTWIFEMIIRIFKFTIQNLHRPLISFSNKPRKADILSFYCMNSQCLMFIDPKFSTNIYLQIWNVTRFEACLFSLYIRNEFRWFCQQKKNKNKKKKRTVSMRGNIRQYEWNKKWYSSCEHRKTS